MDKKFLLFTAKTYYPYGGMDDCKGVFATLQDAIDYAVKKQPSGWLDDTHVLEIGEQLIVHLVQPNNGTVEVSKPINEYMGEV